MTKFLKKQTNITLDPNKHYIRSTLDFLLLLLLLLLLQV